MRLSLSPHPQNSVIPRQERCQGRLISEVAIRDPSQNTSVIVFFRNHIRALPNAENKAAQEPTPRPAETATPTSKYPSECQLLISSFCGNLYTVGKFPKPTFFEVSLGCKSSSRVQRTSDYQSKVGFPYTLDRSPEVVGSRRGLNREPKLYR
jgi:hypothetical protein